eukprot:gene23506-biopygen8671
MTVFRRREFSVCQWSDKQIQENNYPHRRPSTPNVCSQRIGRHRAAIKKDKKESYEKLGSIWLVPQWDEAKWITISHNNPENIQWGRRGCHASQQKTMIREAPRPITRNAEKLKQAQPVLYDLIYWIVSKIKLSVVNRPKLLGIVRYQYRCRYPTSSSEIG